MEHKPNFAIFALVLIGLLVSYPYSLSAKHKASVFALPQIEISLELKNVSLKEVFVQIERQTNLVFAYNNTDVDNTRNLSVNVKSKQVQEVLEEILKGTNLTYTVSDRYITIIKKAAASLSRAGIQQQGKRISGTVLDAAGQSIIGANVTIKGTAVGTITDVDGQFSLNASPGSKLVISYMGYISQEITIDQKDAYTILLVEDAQALDEVVVVGYGSQKRASITGSVASIQSKDITTVKTPNVSNALAGKLPGLRAVQRSGAPGDDDPSIDIRGFGSALVIVDGIQRDFKQIDANDIESISILKDASAAVYGFKGANGVILITTKKGQLSKPKINYTNYFGVQNITRYPDLYEAAEYAMLYNEAQLNVGVNAPYTQEEIEKYRAGNDPAYPNTDWWEEITRGSVPQMYHNVSISGGVEKVKYFFSLGYTDQEGIYKSGDFSFQKYNVRSNISTEIAKGFTVDLQLSGRLDTRNKVHEPEPITRNAQMAAPTLPVYANSTSPYWQNVGDKANPIQTAQAAEIGYDKRDRREFNGSMIFNWEIPWVKGLSAKALLSYDFGNLDSKKWYKEYYDYTYDAAKESYNQLTRHALSELTTRAENTYTPTQQYSLNYANTFGAHNISGLLLWEMRNWRKNWTEAFRQFYIGAIDEIDAGDNVNKNNAGKAEESAHEGLVGRVNYAYAGKYLAELSFRYDGSYKFAADQRWGFFPAVSLGWRISEEGFFKERFAFVDNLKIRGSYGKVGDEGDFAAFQFMSGYTYPDGKYILGSTGVSNGASDKGLPNLNLTWYESTTANIGFELNILHGLFTGEFDYFERRRDGLLADRLLTLPTTFGQKLPQENLNSDKTRGFEIVLGHRNKVGDVTYDVKGNFTTTRELHSYVERATPTNRYDNWRNNTNNRYKSISWGKRAIGQFQSYEEILNAPIQDGNGNKSLMPGDIKFQDWNKDGIIDSKDDQPIGHTNTPSMYYGLNLSADWKGIDLTVFFQGAAGHEVFLGGDLMSPFIQQGLGNGLDIFLDRWHREDPTDPASRWIAGEMPALRPTGYSGNNVNSTWTMNKAGYLRLKTVELGYTFPKTLLSKVGIESLRLYVNAFNLLTFTDRTRLMKFMDPENSEGMFRYYPQMQTFNVGVNLSF
ncbi:MAG: TonB-dependent receptor [Tannerellaceae bacterium]|jgi:TonB-linked SusC/RagA family outer membrane protein|nr:TonB-dependent receptor [Tannerellaceae bacterium]